MTALARAHGVRVLWDLSHSAGARAGAALGARAGAGDRMHVQVPQRRPRSSRLPVRPRDLQPRLRSPIWGWFAQEDQFGMGAEYEPAQGIRRFAAGTPPVLGLPRVETSAPRLMGEAGIERSPPRARSSPT